MKYKLFLDSDQVLFDFEGGVNKLGGLPENTPWTQRAGVFGKKRMWKMVDDAGEEFWENLKPLPYFKELLCITPDFTILTSPGKHPSAASGKTKCFKKRFGSHFKQYIICRQKKWYISAPNHILIDDDPKNIDEWIREGGIGFLWPSNYNVPKADEKSIIYKVKEYFK